MLGSRNLRPGQHRTADGVARARVVQWSRDASDPNAIDAPDVSQCTYPASLWRRQTLRHLYPLSTLTWRAGLPQADGFLRDEHSDA